MSEQLRQKTVDLIAKKWDSVGVFMLGEVAGQMGCSTDQLDKEECLTYMRSKDKRGRFLWGNSVTLHCLPNIIGKSIVVLGLSSGSAFKHTLKAECSTGDVYIGFIPEVHFFGCRPAEKRNTPEIGSTGFQFFWFPLLEFFLGPCSSSCRFPKALLVECKVCRGAHHHICDGDTGSTSTCRKCADKGIWRIRNFFANDFESRVNCSTGINL